MPNTGRPSQDCHLCRQRRVKCDLGRPGCQRCYKYGTQCPGYREQHELVFRNANPITIKKRKKKLSGNKAEPDETTSSSTDTDSSGSISPNHPSKIAGTRGGGAVTVFNTADGFQPLPSNKASGSVATLPRSVTEHWTNHSVPILLNVYSTLSFLHNTYQFNYRNGPLVWAAHLFTRTYVTNIRYPISIYKESVPETKRELGTYLGKTLSAVSAALKEPDGPFRDDVLATVWILTNYELLVGSISHLEPLSPWYLHTRGLYSILKTRGTKMLFNVRGRTAFWPCFNMVQIQALVSRTECPPESAEWFHIIRNSLFEGEAFSLYVAVFITKVAHVQARAVKILEALDFAAAEREYRGLANLLASGDREMSEQTAVAMNKNDHTDLYMRSLCDSALIKGYSFLMALSNFLTHYSASNIPWEELMAQRMNCVLMIRNAAQSILNSLPATLYRLKSSKDKSPRVLFDSLKIIAPLIAVRASPTALPEQKAEAERALGFIAREAGVRQALQTIPGIPPLPLEAQVPLGVAKPDDVDGLGRLEP